MRRRGLLGRSSTPRGPRAFAVSAVEEGPDWRNHYITPLGAVQNQYLYMECRCGRRKYPANHWNHQVAERSARNGTLRSHRLRQATQPSTQPRSSNENDRPTPPYVTDCKVRWRK